MFRKRVTAGFCKPGKLGNLDFDSGVWVACRTKHFGGLFLLGSPVGGAECLMRVGYLT